MKYCPNCGEEVGKNFAYCIVDEDGCRHIIKDEGSGLVGEGILAP